ncbi:hypothetical protein AGENTSMITH_101 [Bacillus phage vB_BspM_AgentSmith]|nr:hypothetical protein AGENTSMITH_101 [Bacillus phage vB_BspM_AgentSmith]
MQEQTNETTKIDFDNLSSGVLLTVIRSNGLNLEHLTDKTLSLCMEAVISNPLSIVFVPEDMLDICRVMCTIGELKKQIQTVLVETRKQFNVSKWTIEELDIELSKAIKPIKIRRDGEFYISIYSMSDYVSTGNVKIYIEHTVTEISKIFELKIK